MIDPKTLGNRIRYFRKRAGLSQLELENSIKASSGMISRIENGTVNPTKESVERISKMLKLNNREIDYLIGVTALPATKEEIEEAIDEVKDYFNSTGVFAYLLDERFRFLHVSKGFERLFKVLLKDDFDKCKKLIIGNTIIGLIFDPKFGIDKYFDSTKKKEFLTYQLGRVYKEAGFMFDDEYYNIALDLIRGDTVASEVWQSLQGSFVNTNSIEAKMVCFDFHGIKVDMGYSRDPLTVNSRFEVLEYFPTNKFLRFMSKLI